MRSLAVLLPLLPQGLIFARGAILEDYVGRLRQNASAIDRVGSLEVIRVEEGAKEGEMDTFAVCNVPLFLPFVSGRLVPMVQSAAAVWLAISHVNNGIGTVIPELEGLNKRCNIRFDAEMIDSLRSEAVAVNKLIEVLGRESGPPCAVLGAARSPVTIAMAILTGIRGIPQFSPYSVYSELDSREKYPLFGRLTASGAGHAVPETRYWCDVVKTKNLVLLYEDEEIYSSQAANKVEAARKYCPDMEVRTISITVKLVGDESVMDQEGAQEAIAAIKSTNIRHIMALVNSGSYLVLMEEACRQGLAGNGDHLWLFVRSLTVSMNLEELEFETGSCLDRATRGIGLVTLVENHGGSERFDRFMEEFSMLGEDEQALEFINSRQPYNNSFIPPQSFQKLIKSGPGFAYDTVVAMALSACQISKPDVYFDGETLFHAVVNSSFEGITGPIQIQPDTGSRDPQSVTYIMLNYQVVESGNSSKYKGVVTGIYQNGTWGATDMPFIYNDGTEEAPSDTPSVSIDYNFIGTALRATGMVLCAIILILSVGFAGWTLHYRRNQVVRASQPIFLLIICGGTFLMGATIIPLSIDDGVASDQGCDIACMFSPWLFATGFSLAFGGLKAKSSRVNQIFRNKRFSRITVKPLDVMKPLFALLFINILVLSLWTGLSPLQWERKYFSEDEFGQPTESIGQCSSSGALPYIIILLVVDLGAMAFALYQAYSARFISSEFSESYYIAVAIAFLLVVCFVGIPVVVIADDNPQARFFVISCIIFVMCTSLLLLIFVPKELFRRSKRSVRQSVRHSCDTTSRRSLGDRTSSSLSNSNSDISGMRIKVLEAEVTRLREQLSSVSEAKSSTSVGRDDVESNEDVDSGMADVSQEGTDDVESEEDVESGMADVSQEGTA